MTEPAHFVPYFPKDDTEYLHGLYYDENYMVFKWLDGDGYISLCQRGKKAACIHFSCARKDLRKLHDAIEHAVTFSFWLFDWCTMLIAIVEKPSVGRFIQKHGFTAFAEYDGGEEAYMRLRDG